MAKKLTDAEKKVCDQLGLSKEEFLGEAGSDDGGSDSTLHSLSPEEKLNDAEKKVCAQLNIDPAAFLENK